jgi:hypothetical protein
VTGTGGASGGTSGTGTGGATGTGGTMVAGTGGAKGGATDWYRRRRHRRHDGHGRWRPGDGRQRRLRLRARGHAAAAVAIVGVGAARRAGRDRGPAAADVAWEGEAPCTNGVTSAALRRGAAAGVSPGRARARCRRSMPARRGGLPGPRRGRRPSNSPARE